MPVPLRGSSPRVLSAPLAREGASKPSCYQGCVLLGGSMALETIALEEVSRIADQELITRLRRLVRADQTLHVRLLVHLGEVDARGLYREHAYSSMFAYCVEELRMSEAEAYLRIQAARY